MSDTIQTYHPDPSKKGVNISRSKYDVIYHAINEYLREVGTAPLKLMTSAVKEKIGSLENRLKRIESAL